MAPKTEDLVPKESLAPKVAMEAPIVGGTPVPTAATVESFIPASDLLMERPAFALTRYHTR